MRTRQPRIRGPLAWLTLLVFTLQSGCAGLQLQAPETAWQDSLGRVAIVSAGDAPEIGFEGFARGKGEGAARGAGSTFAACLGGMGQGGCSGELCGAAMIIMLGICGVAGVVGGVVGAGKAPAAGRVQQSEQVLSGILQPDAIQEELVRRLVERAAAEGRTLVTPEPELVVQVRAAGDYSPLAARDVDTVLEVTLTRAGTRGAGINAPVQLYMETRVRVVRAADNSELFSADYEYRGPRQKLAEWSADRGEALLLALRNGYLALGDHIHDSIFLLFPFPDRKPHAAGTLAHAFGLAPVNPATRGQLTGDVLFGRYFEWKTVDSLRPTLEWEAFPRATDLAGAPDLAGRLRNVRYELVIARERNLAPAGTVYRRNGLEATRHTVQVGLQPDTRYFWSVRARFELDGRERVTEWGAVSYLALGQRTTPSADSYRFKTR